MALYILVARASCSLPEIMTVWLVLWGAAVLPIGLAGTYWHVGSSCQGTRKNWKNPICSLVISTIDVLLASQVRSSGITQLFPCNTSNERKVSIFSLEEAALCFQGSYHSWSKLSQKKRCCFDPCCRTLHFSLQSLRSPEQLRSTDPWQPLSILGIAQTLHDHPGWRPKQVLHTIGLQ